MFVLAVHQTPTLTQERYEEVVRPLTDGKSRFESVTDLPFNGILVQKGKSGQYHFVLKAGNGGIIATSEMYKSKAAAMNGIESVKKNAGDAKVEDETGE